MIGIVLIAHAPLASALASGAAHVYSCTPERAESQLCIIDVPATADVAALLAQGRQGVAAVDDGSGVLVLTDAYGGTPGNIAAQLYLPGKVAVVAGVNLPMLLRTLCYRDGTLAATAEKALRGGQQGILQVEKT